MRTTRRPLALIPAAGIAGAAVLALVSARASHGQKAAAPADLEVLYRDLHSHPELSLREERTAARIAGELAAAGFAVTEHVGGHGVVGVLANGAGPTVLVRTDMDALPVVEATGLPYASSVKATDDQGREVGVMHACGHDAHMTVFVGTARALAAARGRWRGTLVMIGQPAEERGLGAAAMLADGLYTRFPRPDLALALHVSPSLPVGSVGFVPGYAFANVDSVDLTVRGMGGHGASPHRTKDPIVIAAEIVTALQTIVSRATDPTTPAVVTVGSIHGGTTYNIIPDEVRLQITVRSYAPEVRQAILAAIERIARGIALAAGVPADRMPTVKLAEGFTPAVYNDPALVARLAARLRTVLGADHVVELKAEMIGEDFARYGLLEPRIPICMFRLGSVDPARIAESERSGTPLPALHASNFAPSPAATIATGVTAMTEAVVELLAPGAVAPAAAH
ncbi:MAG TPA: amidohydrolase [Thermoanaerobaculaceae bacterium]|nr:amidohydrolase [Thermoanaerobaculaceae bacterium]